eukprot:3995465-Pleurochrysis_carterae.AAC.1
MKAVPGLSSSIWRQIVRALCSPKTYCIATEVRARLPAALFTASCIEQRAQAAIDSAQRVCEHVCYEVVNQMVAS